MLALARLAVLLAVCGLVAACAAPPSKEMDQAQGAIDAARAAGADRYAHDEYSAAVEALSRSDAAVTDRDFRLALNHALDARERAQTAAKLAVEARAAAHGQAEGAVAEVSALVTRARARLQDPEVARLPGRAVDTPRTTIDAAAEALQEARAALRAGDYPAAIRASDGVAARLQAALADLDHAAAGQPRGGRR